MATSAGPIVWESPGWIGEELDLDVSLAGDEDKMRFAIDVAARNVAHGGGPFGAVIVESRTGSILSVGANWVIRERCSLLHAEIAAIIFGQRALGSHTFAVGDYELIASSEPCVQCLGATVWCGVRRLVTGATVEDAAAIGFDEGPRSADWRAELAARGIQTTTGVLSLEAKRVLVDYRDRGGVIYDARASASR
jgi:tRNA(Arg) A34 adenosine deaminase TadA